MTAPAGTSLDALTARPAVVSALRRQTHDTTTLDVEVEHARPRFAPGQFDMLYAHGVGEAAISISSDPADPHLLSHTVRAVGWVTRALCDLQPGATIGLRGPYGRPWPLAGAADRDLVLVAGGIGLAPLRPVVLEALRLRDRFRRLVLLVGARTPRDLLFRDDLAAWDADDRIRVAVTVDRADRGWDGRVGLVTKLVDAAAFEPAAATVFTCGPEIMMRFVARAFTDRGVDASDVHVSLERTMRCGVGTCGHCQLGPIVVCRDGPVVPWSRVAPLLEVREL